MENYIYIVLGIPIAFFLGTLGYQIITLIYLWLKYKIENIKIKEYNLWD